MSTNSFDDDNGSFFVPVAVIGMACRLPRGIDSPERLGEALLRGDDLVTEIPPDCWDADEYYDPEPGVPLSEYGMDSLGALEQRTRIETETGIRIPPTDITTIRGLAGLPCESWRPRKPRQGHVERQSSETLHAPKGVISGKG